MNETKKYVRNITSEEKIHKNGLCLVQLTCDVIHDGEKEKQVSLVLTIDEYISVKNNGYYLV